MNYLSKLCNRLRKWGNWKDGLGSTPNHAIRILIILIEVIILFYSIYLIVSIISVTFVSYFYGQLLYWNDLKVWLLTKEIENQLNLKGYWI